jgi:hypothetical protein
MTYPSSAPEEYSLASLSPKMTAYADLHRDQAVAQTNLEQHVAACPSGSYADG